MKSSAIKAKPLTGIFAGMLAILAIFPGCGAKPSSAFDHSSDLDVTDVSHSKVKRQSIGNCWLYAAGSWVESMALTAQGTELNVSESYWTYWHFYNQMVGGWRNSVSTGGSWATATSIIRAHGLVLEGDFIVDEADVQMSAAQARAESAANAAMAKGGELEKVASRTPSNVRKVLDQAFGVKMAEIEAKATKAKDFVAQVGKDGKKISLADLMYGNRLVKWKQESFPSVYGKTTAIPQSTNMLRAKLLKRVLKALNDHQPVVMALMIDFNALDETDATFKYSKLQAAGGPGHQGGHIVVLEDYTVSDAPGFGSLGAGEMSEDKKNAALDGKIELIKAKNSWGTDRPERGLTDGYTYFDKDYLFKQLGWKIDEENSDSAVSYYTTLTDFVLPAGY